MLGKFMNRIYAKVEPMMDELQAMMESQVHLKEPDKVINLIDKVSLYWAHLNDEDSDYIQGCQYAIEEKLNWNVEDHK